MSQVTSLSLPLTDLAGKAVKVKFHVSLVVCEPLGTAEGSPHSTERAIIPSPLLLGVPPPLSQEFVCGLLCTLSGLGPRAARRSCAVSPVKRDTLVLGAGKSNPGVSPARQAVIAQGLAALFWFPP